MNPRPTPDPEPRSTPVQGAEQAPGGPMPGTGLSEAESAAWALLAAELDTPEPAGPQAQGDTIALPWAACIAPAARAAALSAGRRVGERGIPVVRSLRRRGGHHLYAVGPGVTWTPQPGRLTVGILFVPKGSAALLAHAEHADLRIGAGVWVIRRQRAYDPRPDPLGGLTLAPD